jgi:chromosomal replication initiator protein
MDHPLCPRYTFDTFIASGHNQFAYAAAQAVAASPGKAHNPLYIYGAVGLGKTHLQQAIGRAIKGKWPEMRVAYVCAETFTNELINALRHDRLDSFRHGYRSLDVLLMDSIPFLAGKKQTEEEFLGIFNCLHEGKKQVVIASDCVPQEIPDLDARLCERFRWGVLADLQPSDILTRRVILAKKCEAQGVKLPEDVSEFIAQKFAASVRDLEGALVRVHAYASLPAAPITLSLAQSVLKSMIDPMESRASIEEIQRAVCREFGLSVPQLKAKSVNRRFSYPRQIAMYLAKELTPASLPQIGREFGGKHHTTVLHSINKITETRERDRDLNRLLNKLRDSLV